MSLDFDNARIEVQHSIVRDVFMRWVAKLVIPFPDGIGGVESSHFAVTRNRAIAKARRAYRKQLERQRSCEVIEP